ncbi:MAG: pyruvate formate lyase family protein, partial [Lentisphaeria bacterium]|nr:pyruvate formate lyase family protein [Lentisphaeria bacterium]
HDLKLIYPKTHARYSSRSPKVYLDALNRDYLAGRSVWNILSDDLMIPALVAQGKRLEDARRYLVSGCWGVATEGCEPAAGAPYFNLLRILEASIRPDPQLAAKTGLALRSIEDAADFAEVYDIYADNLRRTIGLVCTAAREIGRHAPEVAPECFYSACLSDCLERHLDATAGGGRYNPQNFAIMSFANTVDSLVAIDELCFRRKRLGLPEFLAAVRADWRDQAALRAEVLGLPHFGDHTPASQGMAKRLFDDIHAATQARENARGGKFQLAFFVYREFIFWGRKMGATPDGRRAGERLSQGISPSQQYPASDLTDLIRSIAQLDLRRCGNSAVVYLNLPVDGMSLDHLETFERTCASMGVSMLQPNCVSTEELLDAKAHPENHPGLVVRVCGFSAKFTSLLPEWQDEFIARRIYGRSA